MAPIANLFLGKPENYKKYTLLTMIAYVGTIVIYLLTMFSGNKYWVCVG
jgi:hypothetical protein